MTATTEIVTNDALRVDIQQTRAEMQHVFETLLDPLDLPGSWTERQRRADQDRRVKLLQHIGWADTLLGQLDKAVASLLARVAERDRLRAAQATIAQQLKDAPQWQTIADHRARDTEWARQNGLHTYADRARQRRRGSQRRTGAAESAAPVC